MEQTFNEYLNEAKQTTPVQKAMLKVIDFYTIGIINAMETEKMMKKAFSKSTQKAITDIYLQYDNATINIAGVGIALRKLLQ